MIDFILKYWLEVLFGLVCGGIAWLAKNYISLMKANQKNQEDKLVKAIEEKMDAQYEKTQHQMNDQYVQTQQQMDSCYSRLEHKINDFVEKSEEEDKRISAVVDNLQDGMLQLQGESFKHHCQQVLNSDDPIGLIEYEQIVTEHSVYNRLGGNHNGDALFKLVQIKYEKQQSTI